MSSTTSTPSQSQSQEEIVEKNELAKHDTHSGTTSKTDILHVESHEGILEISEDMLEGQTVDTFKCGDESNGSQSVNPLLIDLVLEQLMSVMPFESLTESRMVNIAWNNHAITQIRFKHRTINLKKFKKFNEVMNNTLNFPFGDFLFNKIGKQVLKLLDNFGQSLTNVFIGTEELTLAELRHVLTACKRLECLEIYTIPFFSNENFILSDIPQNQIKTLRHVSLFGFHEVPVQSGIGGANFSLLENFFQLTPKLKSIQFGFGTPHFIGKSFQAMNVLSKFPVQNLQNLTIYADISEDEIKTLQKCNFKFKSLKLGHVCIKSTILPVSEFLDSQRDILEELWINSISVRNENDQPPNHPPFCFPIMPKLKIFGMEERCLEPPGTFFVDFQFNSSTFPNLLKFEVYYDSCIDNLLGAEGFTAFMVIQKLGIKYGGVPDEWHGENDQHPHAETLRIRDMFPNMQILMLEAANSIYAEAVFREFINLTELNLEYGYFAKVDTLLTGIHEVHCSSFVLGGELLIGRPAIETYLSLKDSPGICDLKNLRKFKIHLVDEDIQHTGEIRPMTDASGYLALLQMKPLEKLEICDSSQEFSELCIATLTSYHREVKFIQY